MPTNATSKKVDTSPYVFQKRKSNIKFDIAEKIPWTDRQKEFLRLAQDKKTKCIFLSGPAGTSKTILAIYSALKALKEKKVSDIVYVRSAVESATSKLGFLPGDMEEKFGPFLRPLTDKLEELLDANQRKALLSNGVITGIPINHLRGAHFAGKYMLLDEAQNVDVKELTTFLTRAGEFTKVILTGDPMQSDINGKSGFAPLCAAFDSEASRDHGIHIFKFGSEDIVRSDFVKHIVQVIEDL